MGKKGFTLLELLIAMTLSMLVLVAVVSAMELGQRAIRSGQRSAGTEERFRSVFKILDAQLQDMAVLSSRDGQDYTFAGDASSMQFASVDSLWGNQMGDVWVTYTVQTIEDGEQELTEQETIIGTSIQKETVLLPSAGPMSFEYLVRDLKGEQGEWLDHIDADRAGKEVLAVRINFLYGKRNMSMTVPVNVRDSLNKLQAAS